MKRIFIFFTVLTAAWIFVKEIPVPKTFLASKPKLKLKNTIEDIEQTIQDTNSKKVLFLENEANESQSEIIGQLKYNPKLYRSTQNKWIKAGREDNEEVQEHLLSMLQSNEEWQQIFAVRTLASIGRKDELFALMAFYSVASEKVQKTILYDFSRVHQFQYNLNIEELGKIEDSFISILSDMDPSDPFWESSISSLIGLNLPRGLQWAISRWEEFPYENQQILEKAMELIYKNRVLPVLEPCLSDGSWNLMSKCGKVITNINSKQSVKSLFNWYKKSNDKTDVFMAEWLLAHDSKEALKELSNHLSFIKEIFPQIYLEMKRKIETHSDKWEAEVIKL